ncbi:hypothetical protein LR48_Vigan07g066900 [Vigna angularis]|uniref:Uncharacterized protein n=1 Tax=Phaseolus angularis TaxID=3914 RepID=A0A0L9UVV3_PHAAN|nr:hypothetical protein LR48_Vigan07g066900 [Vigna angularis]
MRPNAQLGRTFNIWTNVLRHLNERSGRILFGRTLSRPLPWTNAHAERYVANAQLNNKQTKACTCRNARRQQEYARPGRLEGTIVQKKTRKDARPKEKRERSPEKWTFVQKQADARPPCRADARPNARGRGRSSQAEDARPARRALVQESERSSRRTLVPEADARPEAAGARPRSGRSSSQAEDVRPERVSKMMKMKF